MTSNYDLEEQMNTEDEYLAELIRRDNTISFIKQRLEETSEKLEETSEKLEKTSGELEAERKLRQEKDKVLQEKNKDLQEKDKVLQEKDNLILDLAKTMKENGVPIGVIMEKTKLSKEQLDLL